MKNAKRSSSVSEQAVAFLRGQLLGEADDVLAVVAVLRQLRLLAELLAVARLDRPREVVHLRAGVVDVVLARHFVAREVEHVAQRVADGRAAGMAQVQAAGRVGADELDLHALAGGCAASVILAGGLDLADDRIQIRAVQAEVDEARAGDFRRQDGRLAFVQMLQDRLGDLARVFAGELGQLHRGVRREVAVRLVAGHLQHEYRQLLAGRQAGGDDGIGDALADGGIDLLQHVLTHG